MKKVEVLFNSNGKRCTVMVDNKLYHFIERKDKSGIKVLEPIGWFHNRPLKNGFTIETIVGNGNQNISDKQSLLFYALSRLGMVETPWIKTNKSTWSFSNIIAVEILKNILSYDVMNSNKQLASF
jgi:hypothetical protein